MFPTSNLKHLKNRCSMNRFAAGYKCSNKHSKTYGQRKMKRLRSRKERSQIRGDGREASKHKSHHCHHQRSATDMAHSRNCCHSSCHCPARRNASFPNVGPAAQEPSIITDSRLIGHHGLFNHEVKSVKIERLLIEQSRREKSGQQVPERSYAASHPSSTSHIPSSFSTNDLLCADTDEVVPFEQKADLDDCRKTEQIISEGSDLTPGQRTQQQLNLSSESFKSTFSSKHNSLNVPITKSKTSSPVVSEKGRESQQTPTVVRENVKTLNRKVKGHMISTLEHSPKNLHLDSPNHQTRAHGRSPSPPQLSSSNAADSFDMQQRKQDPNCVARSVSALAASLCDCLRFPLLRRRNLVSESREVLLRALRERHGPRLQENLLKVQGCLSFGVVPEKKVQGQKRTMMDELLIPDVFTTTFRTDTASQPRFDTQKTTSFRMRGSGHFNRKSKSQLHHNLDQEGFRCSAASLSPTNMDNVTATTDYWDYDYDNFTWSPETSKSHAAPCSQEDIYGFAQRYSPVVYSLVFILALVGNVLVLRVIQRYRNSQSGGACAFSLTDTFLLHLAISDLLLAFTLPLFAVQWAHQWVFGLAVCKISGALFSLNRYSGILFLACISFDRYLAIVHAVSSGWKRNTCHAQIACAIIWVCCLGLSGVDIIFKQVVEVNAVGHQKMLLCQVWFTENSTQWQVGLQLLSVVLGFGLPLLIMLYCYIRIFRSLCNASRRQKRKSLRLIISLVSVFVLCWAPYNCFQLADSLHRLGVVIGGCQFGHVVDIGTLITESMGLSHCALNPLLYGFVGVKFRRELVKMCKGLLGQRGLLGMEEWRHRKRSRSSTIAGSRSSADSENTSYSVMM